MRFFGIAIAAASLLAGCAEGTMPAGSARADVQPGSGYADSLIVGTMFTQICVDTLPDFKKAQSAIPSSVFNQHPETGTYYHANLDLSVKIRDLGNGKTACSMVFSSKDDPGQIALMMSLGAAGQGSDQISIDPTTNQTSVQLPRGAEFTFTPTGRNGGRQYYRAAVVAAS